MHVACIRTHLISGASAVSLIPRPEDWTSNSPSLFCAGMQGGACERSYSSLTRLPQQLHEQHALLSLLFWAYSACVLLALLFERRGTLSHSIYVSLSAPPWFAGSFAGHIDDFVNFRID